MVTKRVARCIVLFILGLGLMGCESSARKDAVGISLRVDQDIAKTQDAKDTQDRHLNHTVERASRPTKMVKIPRHAQWLRLTVDAKYTDAPVKLAISAVLDGRPYRFQLVDEVTQANESARSAITLPNGDVVSLAEPREQSEPSVLTTKVSNTPEASTIKQHLDSISAQAGLSYMVENGVVVFSDRLVETFAIKGNSLDDRQAFRFSNEVVDGSATLPSSGIYRELNEGLSRIVFPPNSFAVNQTANSVTVRATRRVMREVKRYLDLVNYAAGRRVAIRMDIYDINLSALGQRSFDFDIKDLLADSSKLKGFIGDISIDGSSSVSIQSPPTTLGLRIEDQSSDLNGATALLRVLRGKGAVTKRTAKEFVVSNNEQINEIRTRITPYVSGVSIDQVTTGVTQSATPSIETREANTGTAIQLHPTIAGDRVYIQMTIEDSSLIRFDDFKFGGEEGVGLVSGKLPVTEVSQSQYEFAMRDGETIAVAGSITSARAHDVVNGSLVPLLGDSVDKSEQRTQSLIFVTSNILD